MNRLAAFALAFFAAPAFAAGSPVATLGQQQGTVMVNQGEVFATATENQALSAGDRVLVMEGGSATLVFSDGCELPLAEGSLLEVGATSPCAGQVAQVQSIGPSYAQAVGDGESDRDWGNFVLGATAFGAFYFLGKDGYSNRPPVPVSP